MFLNPSPSPPPPPPHPATNVASPPFLPIALLQARKRKDLYLWMSKAGSGPSVKFLVKNSEYRRRRLMHNHTRPPHPCAVIHVLCCIDPSSP